MTEQNPTAAWYLRAATELADTSAVQTGWANAVARDPGAIALIEQLPREHRQPSLLFSVAHYLGATGELVPWLKANWPDVARIAARRRTQTNEVLRCAPLVAALDRLADEPIALIEVGASAGLCLAPDAYGYAFEADGRRTRLGAGAPLLECTVTGGPAPARLPRIVWRRGIDLHPLDPRDADDRRWLRALLPPDRPERAARLDSALDRIRDRPPTLVAGDAVAALPAVLAQVPSGMRIVVAALGTLVYLAPAARSAVLDIARAHGAHTVTLEPESALPDVAALRAGMTADEPTPFLLALDGRPIACVTPHGDRVSWLRAA